MPKQNSNQKTKEKKENPVNIQKRSKECYHWDPNRILSSPEFQDATEYQVNLATAISQTIRQHLSSVIPYPSSPTMHDKLKKELTEYVQCGTSDPEDWIDCVWMIDDFDFTPRGIFDNKSWVRTLKIKYVSSTLIKVIVPEFIPTEVIDAYGRTESVKCKIAMSVLYPQTGIPIANAETEFIFPFNNSVVQKKIIPIEIPTPKMSILVTGLLLEFQTNHKYVMTSEEKRNYVQAAIIDAMGV
jgi:hypothetical protein